MAHALINNINIFIEVKNNNNNEHLTEHNYRIMYVNLKLFFIIVQDSHHSVGKNVFEVFTLSSLHYGL